MAAHWQTVALLDAIESMKSLARWDEEFACALQEKCPRSERVRAGVLLSVIPDRRIWNDFLSTAQAQASSWGNHPDVFPNSLLLLYSGLAFYEYDDNMFWPGFSRSLRLPPLPGNQQHVWNSAFEKALLRGGFRFFDDKYVGSAVYLVGIPLSMWEGFLTICQWALWKTDWPSLSDPDWQDTMQRRLGGHKRLIRFLTENRNPTASEFISEMLDARKILTEDHTARISTIAQASILRREYFEEVPETADFLRPQNPDSLLDDKPRLLWREKRVGVHLPPVSDGTGEWDCFGQRAAAAAVAGEMPLNGKAFAAALCVKLQSGEQSCSVEMSGLHPYGLFDEQRQRFANLKRSRLPTGAYRLISKERIYLGAKDKDWTVEENEVVELEDTTQCFVTYLWPVSDRPQLVINGCQILRFGRVERVNLRVYSGSENSHVLRFAWRDEILVAERLPHLVLEIPCGFLSGEDVSDEEMRAEFAVQLDGRAASGRWVWFQNYPEASPEWDYYQWRWDHAQVPQRSYEVKVRSKKLGDLPFGLRPSQRVTIASPTDDALWPRPSRLGKFWIWALLAQIQDEPTWEEFWIARQAIAGFQDLNINQNDWKKLDEWGYVRRRKQFLIQKSTLLFARAGPNEIVTRFTGLPNRLYLLVQQVKPLQQIKVVEERGLPPCLEIVWPAYERQFLTTICQQAGITVVGKLWNHGGW
jgi:hypothetical protein